MQRLTLVVGLLALVAVASASATTTQPIPVFLSLEDRPADPINARAYGLQATDSLSQDPTPQFGPSANIFYLPSAQSAGLTAAIAAGTQTLRLRALPPIRDAATTNYIVGLATQNGQCAQGFDPMTGMAIGGFDPDFVTVPITARRTLGDIVEYDFTAPTTGANAWNSIELEIESSLGQNGAGRRLCIQQTDVVGAGTGPITWTGIYIKVAWNCAGVGGPDEQQCSAILLSATQYQALTPLQLRSLSGTDVRTQCCKSTTGLQVGVCINPAAQTCCGGNPIFPGQKCCSAVTEIATYDAAPCPCRSEAEVVAEDGQVLNTDCQEPTGTAVNGTLAANKCCLPSIARFPELADEATGSLRIESGFAGFCYREGGPLKCCATGELYDPGSAQCCVINGVQSADEPCLCANDAHCAGGQTDFHTSTQRCCRGTFPDVPMPHETEVCNAYTNYPFLATTNGYSQPAITSATTLGAVPTQVPARAQRCFGQCIDTSFQICCNGVACARRFERCCNQTCCNRFTATCRQGIDSGLSGGGSSFRVATTRCSQTYFLHGLRSFFIFALPAFLLLSTLLGLAIVLVFANKASNRSYSFIESGMILFALIAIIFALPTYFSPAFKYGVLIVLVGLITILSAAARVRSLNVLALAALVLALLYTFDPFTGNQYLNLVSFRTLAVDLTGRQGNSQGPWSQQRVPGQPDYLTNGLLHMITHMWRDSQNFCVDFYDYFRLDFNLLDTERYDNPAETTYGYCRRGWVFALLIFEVIAMTALFILTVITLIALLLRFRKQADLAPVELEVKML